MLAKRYRQMTILEKTEAAYRYLSAEEATSGQAAQVRNLLDKLKEEDVTVAVIGQFKRGKSALSNRILGAEVLPVGIVPITSAVTRVRYGARSAEVRFRNGVTQQIDFSDLHTYISEQENRNNVLDVEEVLIHTESDFLKNGFTFVDTPGVGSFHKNNTVVAYDHMKESDAVIFLLSVDSPINQIEIDFLKNTRAFAAKFYFAVNKADLVSEQELQAYVEYCRGILSQLMETEDIQMFPVSARTGEGVEALKEAILADLSVSSHAIMEESTAKKLYDVLQNAVTQLDFYWSAMNLEYKELDARFEKIHEALSAVREKAAACESGFAVHLNDYKLMLADTVKDLFGMEYHYDIDTLRAGMMDMDKQEFLAQTEALCEDLSGTLNRILLYREENAYKVCHRINAINRLLREMRRIQDTVFLPVEPIPAN
ncbi:MAG: dynamin family protein [Eubacterium sp.]|nr:dynamin family protein [Eubacterium sp.]